MILATKTVPRRRREKNKKYFNTFVEIDSGKWRRAKDRQGAAANLMSLGLKCRSTS